MRAKPSPGADPDPARPPVIRAPRRRRWPWVVLAFVLLAVGAHAALWAWSTARLEAELQAWVALRRAQGWQVEHGTPARAGWPTEARVDLPGAALSRDGIGWQAARLSLSLSPLRPDRLHLAATGPQALRVGGPPVPMQADGLVADLPLGADATGIAGLPRDAALRADRLRLDLPAGPLELAAVRLDLATGDGSGAGDPLAAVQGMAQRLTLPPSVMAAPGLAALGPAIERISLRAVLSGPWPGTGGSPDVQAARWRDGGGTLELRELALGWGEAQARATAVLALDPALQPAGEGAVQVAGAGSLLDAARQAGLVGRRELATAQMLLALMQRSPPGGGPPQIEVPVSLEQRALAVGGMTLLRLPALRWPLGRPPG